jgi:hypothetical protein
MLGLRVRSPRASLGGGWQSPQHLFLDIGTRPVGTAIFVGQGTVFFSNLKRSDRCKKQDLSNPITQTCPPRWMRVILATEETEIMRFVGQGQPRQKPDPIINIQHEPGTVAHVCNPSHTGGRDQEDHSLKPARTN